MAGIRNPFNNKFQNKPFEKIISDKRKEEALERLKALPTFETTLLAVATPDAVIEPKNDEIVEKKSANDYHKIIKKLYDSKDLEGAIKVLNEALDANYSSKQLNKWKVILFKQKDVLDEYVEEREKKNPGFKKLVEKEIKKLKNKKK
jgi:hypothetical protein